MAPDPPQRDLLLTGSGHLNFFSFCEPYLIPKINPLEFLTVSHLPFMFRHEDGTVRLWNASGVCLYPMYKLSTAGVFHTDTDPNDNLHQGAEGDWPPFRKVRVEKHDFLPFLHSIHCN